MRIEENFLNLKFEFFVCLTRNCVENFLFLFTFHSFEKISENSSNLAIIQIKPTLRLLKIGSEAISREMSSLISFTLSSNKHISKFNYKIFYFQLSSSIFPPMHNILNSLAFLISILWHRL